MKNRRNLKCVIGAAFMLLFCETTISQVNLAPPPGKIKETIISAELRYLSSPFFEGRKTGERGNEMAAEYFALAFEQMELEPVQWKKFPKAAPEYSEDENGSFFQEVPLFRFTVSKEELLTVTTYKANGNSRTDFNYGNDFGYYYVPTSRNVDIKAPVVFAGYGVSMPDRGYDDFQGIDVNGKIVLISMGYPGYKDTTSTGYRKMKENKIREYSRWNKYAEAKKKGAAAVLFLYTTAEWYDPTGGDYQNYTYGEKTARKKNIHFEFALDSLEKEVPFVIVSSRIGHEIFSGTGINLDKFDSSAASLCKPASTLLKDKTVDLKITKNASLIRSSNIIGCIPGEIPDEFVLVGAHYDHIGKADGFIYCGSDDNASGTVAVMAIARACKEMKVKPKRTILFALWTAEEEGLMGSRYFLGKWNKGKIDACFNFDMVSRYNPKDSANFLTVTLPTGFTRMQETLDQINKNDSLGLRIHYAFEKEDEYGGSDYAPFGDKGIPFCWFFTGFHPDYHEETDLFYKANVEDMTKIVNLGFRAVWERAN